jgi:hypothetical protein
VPEEKHRRESSGPKDALDLGVPMAPGEPGDGPQGPEDALDPNARGDYTGRLGGGASYQSRVVGYREDGYGLTSGPERRRPINPIAACTMMAHETLQARMPRTETGLPISRYK